MFTFKLKKVQRKIQSHEFLKIEACKTPNHKLTRFSFSGFALGHLIHSVLQITVQVGYLTDDNIDNDECIDYPQFSYDIASPLYCFIQLYFIFKYSNVHILKAQVRVT